MQPIKLLGICGSLRKASYNHHLLGAVAQVMPASMGLQMVSLADIALYNQDVEAVGIPAPVQALRDQILAADGLVIASPEYNFSITGVLKNTIDWLSRCKEAPFKDKPVAILSATQGPVGGARNQYELRKVLGCLEAQVLMKPEVFVGQCHTKFDASGQLTDEVTRKVLAAQQLAFEAWINRWRKAMA